MSQDRVALITAGGSGIGAAAARKLAEEEYHVGNRSQWGDTGLLRKWPM